jgi:hypothetical protein
MTANQAARRFWRDADPDLPEFAEIAEATARVR